VASGVYALDGNATGTYNTAIGHSADVGFSNLTNATAIGYGATVASSNSIQLGNTSVSNVKTSGTITAGAITIPNSDGLVNQVLSTNGSGTLSWVNPTAGISGALTGITNITASGTLDVGGKAEFLNTFDAFNLFTPGVFKIHGGAIIQKNLEVGSNITANNFIARSDRRLKNDITNTKYGLQTILELVPVDYQLKSNDHSQIGFVAQDLKPIVPEAVTGIEGDLTKGETLGVNYTMLIPVLTKAIQEQQALIESQQQSIEAQNKVIQQLQKDMLILKQK